MSTKTSTTTLNTAMQGLEVTEGPSNPPSDKILKTLEWCNKPHENTDPTPFRKRREMYFHLAIANIIPNRPKQLYINTHFICLCVLRHNFNSCTYCQCVDIYRG